MEWLEAARWLNPPAHWAAERGSLRLQTLPRTDFWQETHYGFRRDDGHFLHRAMAGDFDIETELWFEPNAQYDQAGLMVRIDAGTWLKASVEFEVEGLANLGAVVTNAALSDWSMQAVAAFDGRLRLRIQRRQNDYTVFAATADAALARIRLARLHADNGVGPVLVGPYACSPTGEGCVAFFRHVTVTWP